MSLNQSPNQSPMLLNFKNLYRSFASHPEASWIMKPQNAYALYQFVKGHEIKKVLDLGTGIGASASIIALALKEKGAQVDITSIEQSDKCIRLANELIPEPLKNGIDIRKGEVTVWETDLIPHQKFSIYKGLLNEGENEGEYDFILNDGPAPFLQGDKWVDLPNGSIIKFLLERKLKPGTSIAWDGRRLALQTVERYFGDNFLLTHPAKKGTDFNVIERKDNEVIFRDDMLEMMKETSYFDQDENPNKNPDENPNENTPAGD